MRVRNIHPHTRLVNYAIDLCSGNKRSYSQLDGLDYTVQIIEQEINTSKGFVVKPDIIKVSKKCNHVLLIECKSGNMNRDQMLRYKTMTNQDLKGSLLLENMQPEFDFCIISVSNDVSPTIEFPTLVYSENSIHKINCFKLSPLEQIFEQDIDLSQRIPSLSYYPFSANDDEKTILTKVFQGMISYYMKRHLKNTTLESLFNDDDFLSTLHPFWKSFSDSHKKELRSRIKNSFRNFIKSNPELKDYLRKLNTRKYKLTQKFTEKCYETLNSVPSKIITLNNLPR